MEIHLPHLRGQIRQKAAEKGEKCGMFILYLDRKPTIPANDYSNGGAESKNTHRRNKFF